MTITFTTEPAAPTGILLEFVSPRHFVTEVQAAYGLGQTAIFDIPLANAIVGTLRAAGTASGANGAAELQRLIDEGGMVSERAAQAAFEAYALRKGTSAAVLGTSGWEPFLFETMGAGAMPAPPVVGGNPAPRPPPPPETILGMPKPVAIGVGVALGAVVLVGIVALAKRA